MTTRIDIVADIVCPWCVVGYKQLESALRKTGTQADIHWQPFELNPEMPEPGENLNDHLMKKYSLSAQQVDESHEKLTNTGNEIGFKFGMTAQTRIVNTFRAHQLVHWAATLGLAHQLQITLFHCHFNRERNINDIDVLANACVEAGLPFEEALEVLEHQTYSDAVRERQRFVISNGVRGVPAMIFNQQILEVGAQGEDKYVALLRETA